MQLYTGGTAQKVFAVLSLKGPRCNLAALTYTNKYMSFYYQAKIIKA